MYRKIVLIALCLSFAVTACNNGGKKRVSLKKGKGGPIDAKASEGTKGMNKALADTKCLRVDTYFTTLTGQKEETVLVYTSDVNVGTLNAVGGKDASITPEQDQKVRAVVALDTGSDPLVVSSAAKDIYGYETIAQFYVSAIDVKCELADIKAAGGTFDIVKSHPDELLLVKKGNPQKSIRYKYDRATGKMTITQINPAPGSVCGRNNRSIQQTYVIARDKDMQTVELENGYAKVIVDNIEEPAELTKALAASTGRVSVPTATMDRVRQTIFNPSTTKPVCP